MILSSIHKKLSFVVITKTQTAGFIYEERDDGIKVYRLMDLKRETVDAFCETNFSAGIDTISAGRHNRSLVDVSALTLPTPYAAKRFQILAAKRPPDSRSSVAILTPSHQVYIFARAILSHLSRNEQSHIHLFNAYDEVFAWLDKRLEELGP